ncbi:S8 family serine peptidase [Nonomuraea longicatena]|uniref:S8 family serine peptidase n=1 Tax=Nonomuraea longicatena TaxID=83682 RepID=A0ABN1QKU4_9ACTN
MTLITGDRVTVVGRTHRVEPGPGRTAAFSSQTRKGHLYVIPSDAAPLVAQGVLDERLFDVTRLLAWNYGDAHTPDIPVIRQGAVPEPRHARRTQDLGGVGMSALRVPKGSAAQSWKELTGQRALTEGGGRLWLDGQRSWLLDHSTRQIGAPQAWAQGLTGQGVTVAVLDSGYDREHPDLKPAVKHERVFNGDPDMTDDANHGTHVASIVASRNEKYRGVAPGVDLAIGKVGNRRSIPESAIIAGMEWAARDIRADVVSLSLGDPDGSEIDPLEETVNRLSAETDALFVIAAGNSRWQGGRVGSPGSAEAALTVGAVTEAGGLTDFTSPGPRIGDHAVKPDVVAPGENIMAAKPGGGHQSLDGTSMAAPHVAGAAAILAQRYPDWTGEQLKAALTGSAAPLSEGTQFDQGAGLIDLVRGVRQPVIAEPANVWAPFRWDTAERTATKTITYRNSSDTPLTLDLSVRSEVLKLSADRLDVPAKGQATLTLQIDATGKPTGEYPGTVTATSGDTVVRTLAGAYVEPESHDVAIEVLDRQGQRTSNAQAELYRADTGEVIHLTLRDGRAQARLNKGDWNLFAEVREGRTLTYAALAVPVEGAGGRVVLDTRQGRQVRSTVDDTAATRVGAYNLSVEHGQWSSAGGWFGLDPNRDLFVVPRRERGLRYTLETVWKSDKVYELAHRDENGIPDDPAYHAKRAELAEVTATYRASGVASEGEPMSTVALRMGFGYLHSTVGTVPLPATVTYLRSPGVSWHGGLFSGSGEIVGEAVESRPGRTREVWNAAVSGPAFPVRAGERTGDALTFHAGNLFSDGVKGRHGSDTAATGTVTLAEDGRVLARADLAGCTVFVTLWCRLSADLPQDRATYTLTASARRQVPHSTLSTGVDAVWTFPSARTRAAEALPLTAVRYAPEGLDDHNRAKAGTTTRVPVWLEHNPGSKNSVRSLKLEVSADDGATWQAVKLVRTSAGYRASVRNPDTAGFVSLRANLVQGDGVRTTQTITRAYAVN